MNHQTKPIRGSTLSAPDQTVRAQELIDGALASWDGESIATAMARVIAASVHAGPGTALGHFAGSGELDADRALLELQATPTVAMHWLWRGALAGYLREQRGSGDE